MQQPKKAAAKKTTAKVEKTTEVSIYDLKPESLEILKDLETKQKAIVEANPLIEKVTKENYEEAKKRRTALLSASTAIEKEDKNATSFLSTFRKKLGELLISGAKITRDAFDLQQAPITEYEDAVEREKARIAEEKRLADEAVKNKIAALEQQMLGKISAMAYDQIAAVSKEIATIIESNKGTFDKFDILFEVTEDKVNAKLETTIESLTKDFEQAEAGRKAAHQQKLNKIEIDAKDIILNVTFSNLEDSEKKLHELLKNTGYDWQEFADDFADKTSELLNLYATAKQNARTAEDNRIEQEQKDQELENLRKDKTYNIRAKDLRALGMEELENGDFKFNDTIYAKSFIESDTDDEFIAAHARINGEMQLFESQQKNEQGIGETEEAKAEDPANAANDIEVLETPAEEEKVAFSFEPAPSEQTAPADNPIEEPMYLGRPTTMGDFRAFTEEYADNALLNFRNMPVLSLFKTEIDGQTVIYFAE